MSAMARVLSDRSADACNIDRADNWAMYGQEYIEDVQAMLSATPAQPAAHDQGEVQRLRGTMMEVVTKNFAKNLGRAAKDKELDYYLSEGIRKLQAERDALAAEAALLDSVSGVRLATDAPR